MDHTHGVRFESLSSCPLCGSIKIFQSHRIDEWSLWRCRNCRIIFLNPRPADVDTLYQSENYFVARTISFTNLQARARGFYPMINKLRNCLNGKKQVKFVEIGAGDGAFSLAAQHFGWEVLCVEVSAVAREKLRALNLKVFDTIENGLPAEKNSVDVVVMNHVLEHLKSPGDVIKSVEKRLRAGGILYVATPNHASLDRLYHGKHWSGWDLPFHLTHFSPGVLRTFLKHFGFHVFHFDFTFFNPITHIIRGLAVKNLRKDLRSPVRNFNQCHPFVECDDMQSDINRQLCIDSKLTPKWRVLIKRIFGERNMAAFAQKIV